MNAIRCGIFFVCVAEAASLPWVPTRSTPPKSVAWGSFKQNRISCWFSKNLPSRKTNDCPLKRGLFQYKKYIWTNHFFSKHSFVFRGVIPSDRLFVFFGHLGGGFQHFLFSPLGKRSNWTNIFFRWVVYNHQLGTSDAVCVFSTLLGGISFYLYGYGPQKMTWILARRRVGKLKSNWRIARKSRKRPLKGIPSWELTCCWWFRNPFTSWGW